MYAAITAASYLPLFYVSVAAATAAAAAAAATALRAVTYSREETRVVPGGCSVSPTSYLVCHKYCEL